MVKNFIHDTWDEEWVDLEKHTYLDPEPIAQLWRCYNTKRDTMKGFKVSPWTSLYPLFSTSSGFFPDGTNPSHVRSNRNRRYGGEELKRLWVYLLSEDINGLMRECIIDNIRYLWANGTEESWTYTPFPGYLEVFENYYLYPVLWKTMIEEARAFFDTLDMLVSVDVTEHVVKVTQTRYVWTGVNEYTKGAWENNVYVGRYYNIYAQEKQLYEKTTWGDLGTVKYSFVGPTVSTRVFYVTIGVGDGWNYSTIGKFAYTSAARTDAICTAFAQTSETYPFGEVVPHYRPVTIYSPDGVSDTAVFPTNPIYQTRAYYSSIKLEAVDWGFGETFNVYKTSIDPPYGSSVIGTLSTGGSFTVSSPAPDTSDVTKSFGNHAFSVDYSRIGTSFKVYLPPGFTSYIPLGVVFSSKGYAYYPCTADIPSETLEYEGFKITVRT